MVLFFLMTRRRMPFEKKVPLPFFTQVNSNMLVIGQPQSHTGSEERMIMMLEQRIKEMKITGGKKLSHFLFTKKKQEYPSSGRELDTCCFVSPLFHFFHPKTTTS